MIGRDRRLTAAQNLIGGGAAGVTARTLTSPLDVVKILAQVGTADSRGGFVKTFYYLHREEGWRAFWKGNTAALIRIFPYSAIQFTLYNKLKNVLCDRRGNLSAKRSFVAGSAGGVVATCAVYPFDMVKTRLTVQRTSEQAKKYKGVRDAFATIAKEEGVWAFYKGMSTSILGVIPFAGGAFMANEILGTLWGKPKSQLNQWQIFLNGCLAGAFAQTISFPFDTIRKKLQVQSIVKDWRITPADVEFDGVWDCFKQTVRKHGILGLWRGTVANLVRVVPYMGILFLTFESCKKIFLYQNGYTVSPWKDQPKPGVNQRMTPQQLKKSMKMKEAQQNIMRNQERQATEIK